MVAGFIILIKITAINVVKVSGQNWWACCFM